MRYRATRRATDKPVTLITDHGPFPGQLLNYSRTGVAIKGLPRLAPNSEVTMRLLSTQLRMRIVWQRDALAGAMFLHPLSAEEARLLNPHGGQRQHVTWHRQAHARLGARPMGEMT